MGLSRDEIAKRVARTGREEELDPMNPYERKVVHDAVEAGLLLESAGEVRVHTGQPMPAR